MGNIPSEVVKRSIESMWNSIVLFERGMEIELNINYP